MPRVAPPTDSDFGRLQERHDYLYQELEALKAQVQNLRASQDATTGALAKMNELLIMRGQQNDRFASELRLNTETTQRVEKSVETILEVFENLRALWTGLSWLSAAFVSLAKVLAPIAILGAVVLAFWGSARSWVGSFFK